MCHTSLRYFKSLDIKLTNLSRFFLSNYVWVCVCTFYMCMYICEYHMCNIFYVLYCNFWIMEIMVLNSFCGMVHWQKFLRFISNRSHCRRFSSSQVSLKESLESRRWYWKPICFYEVFKTSTFSSFWRYSYSQKSLYYKRWYYSTLFQSKTQLFQKMFLPFDSYRME